MPSSCEALRFSGRCFSLYSFIGMNRLPVPLFAIIAVPSPARPARVVRRPLSIFPDGALAALVDVLLAALADVAPLVDVPLVALADVALVLAVLQAALADVAPVLAVLLLADVLVLLAGRRSE